MHAQRQRAFFFCLTIIILIFRTSSLPLYKRWVSRAIGLLNDEKRGCVDQGLRQRYEFGHAESRAKSYSRLYKCGYVVVTCRVNLRHSDE